jgi:flagellar biosynthesis GTPase FlhF
VRVLSKISDFLSNKYLILLIFIVCIYFAFTTFESVDEEKNNINVSIIQKNNTNIAEQVHNPTFKVELIAIDNKLPNPFLSSWLRQKAIEEKQRLDAEAEAKKIQEALKKEKQGLEQERIAKEKEMKKNKEQQTNKLQQQKAPKQVDKKPTPKPKQKKQFRYIGHTQVNHQELILIEVLENKKIHYINKDDTIESYKINAFNNEQIELIKDDKIFIIKRGNIVLLEI